MLTITNTNNTVQHRFSPQCWVIFVHFYVLIMKMFHHPPYALENRICDVGKNKKMCINSRRYGLESDKHATIG